jgi:Tol biopolymer transport system component
MSAQIGKRTGLSLLLVLGLLLSLSFLVGSVLAGDAQEQTASESEASGSKPEVLSPQAVITPTSNYVLYHRPDGLDTTIWLLTGISDTKIITGHRPRLSPDGRYVIYLEGDEEPALKSDIHVYDLQTETDTEVFSNWDWVMYYAWKADGSKIIYDFRCGIYSMDPDGSNQQQLIGNWPTDDYCYNDAPDVNPVDGRIAWENGYYGIGVADADGGNPYWAIEKLDVYDPRWSPDGEWIVFWDDDNAYKIRPDGTDLTQLTFLQSPDYMNWVGDWTRDGQFLVGAGVVKGVEGIYAYTASGSGLIIPLLQEPGAHDFFIGNAGILDIELRYLFLPLVTR